MMTLNYLIIGLGIVSIGFLIYLLVKSFKNDKQQKATTTDTITRRVPEPIDGLNHRQNNTVALAAPKKPFSAKVDGYNKNVRVNNIVVEDANETFIDIDPIEIGVDVADVVNTVIYMGSQPSQPYPSVDVITTPSESVYQPSDNYSAPVQDSWSPSPSYDSDSPSSYSDSSSSYSSYDSGSSSSSYDSGSSSYDSGSSDSSW